MLGSWLAEQAVLQGMGGGETFAVLSMQVEVLGEKILEIDGYRLIGWGQERIALPIPVVFFGNPVLICK